MDFDVIPSSFLSLNEKMLAIGRLLVVTVIVLLLLRQYCFAQLVIVAVAILLGVYIFMNFIETHENFDYDCEGCQTNAAYAALNPDPRLYAPVCIPARSHAREEWQTSPYAVPHHINTYRADPLEQAGMLSVDGLPSRYVTRPEPVRAVRVRSEPDKDTFVRDPWEPHAPLETCDDKRTSGLTPQQRYEAQRRVTMLQPGVYTHSDRMEPLITNMGISFLQEFAPVVEHRQADRTIFSELSPTKEQNRRGAVATDARDVFDPRSAGYSDARRYYVEPMTGQGRWYYDDIDKARSEPFIQRSLTPHVDSGLPLNSMHAIADAAFIETTNQHRIDLQERLMRKCNEMTRQRRMAPIRTF
jgi:hypothetical protein